MLFLPASEKKSSNSIGRKSQLRFPRVTSVADDVDKIASNLVVRKKRLPLLLLSFHWGLSIRLLFLHLHTHTHTQ